jgi:hypothetical protein
MMLSKQQGSARRAHHVLDAAAAEEKTMRDRLRTHTATVVLAGVFAGALAATACGPQPPPYKPVVDVKGLMQGIVEPASDVVWDSVATIFTKDGVEERQPRTKEEWEHVRSGAMMLTEAGNLLMMPPRAKDGGEWMKFSQELVDTASVALRAAEARNVDELYRIGGIIDEACENCHKKYWPNY